MPWRYLAFFLVFALWLQLAVGVQGVAIAERAFQQALAFSQERRQGRAAWAADGAIYVHPDIRRSLLLRKAKGEAARAIGRQVPEARIVCAGEDRGGADGRGGAASILRGCPPGARERLVFAGEVDEASLVELYAESSVCVVPSMIYESFSYTAAQAMSCARPVAASRIGGIPEVVEDGVTGQLVEPGNAEELADAVCRLLEDRETATTMGAAGRRRVLDLYDPARVAAQNRELLGLAKAGGTRTLSGAAPLTTPGERL